MNAIGKAPAAANKGAPCLDQQLDRVTLLNGLEALAHAVPHLQPREDQRRRRVAKFRNDSNQRS